MLWSKVSFFGWMGIMHHEHPLQRQGNQPGVSKERAFGAKPPWVTGAQFRERINHDVHHDPF